MPCLVCLFGILTYSSTTRLYRERASNSVWQFYVLPHMRQSWETTTSVSAGHILTTTQPVKPWDLIIRSRTLYRLSYRAPGDLCYTSCFRNLSITFDDEFSLLLRIRQRAAIKFKQLHGYKHATITDVPRALVMLEPSQSGHVAGPCQFVILRCSFYSLWISIQWLE